MKSKTFLIDQKDKRPVLEFDAIISLSKRLTNKTPKFPVGKGEDISENVVTGLTTITLEGMVSDADPRVEFAVLGGQDEDLVVNFIKDLPIVKQFIDLGNRVTNTVTGKPALDKSVSTMISEGSTKLAASVAEATLKAAATSKRLFTLEEGGNIFENLVFKSLVIRRDNKSHRVLKFTAQLEQIRIVTFKEIRVSSKPVTELGAAPPQKEKGNALTVKELVGLADGNGTIEGTTSAAQARAVALAGQGLGRGGR